MRRALALITLAAVLLSGCDLLTGDFRLSGTVDVAPRLRGHVPRQNAMLFLIASNEGGVPVAMQRIVNPEFPASFEMLPADLLVPAVRSHELLTVRATLNTHGHIGAPRPGDLEGEAPGTYAPRSSGVRLILDRTR